MIHSIFSIHDAKASAFLPPFILPRVEMAQRVFSDCVNSEDHQFGQHPEDYTLFHMGNFDDETGEIHPKTTPTSLGLGLEYRKKLDSENLDMFSENSDGSEVRQKQVTHIQPSSKGRNSKK